MKNSIDFIGQLIVEIIMGYHGGEAPLSFCVVVTGKSTIPDEEVLFHGQCSYLIRKIP